MKALLLMFNKLHYCINFMVLKKATILSQVLEMIDLTIDLAVGKIESDSSDDHSSHVRIL